MTGSMNRSYRNRYPSLSHGKMAIVNLAPLNFQGRFSRSARVNGSTTEIASTIFDLDGDISSNTGTLGISSILRNEILLTATLRPVTVSPNRSNAMSVGHISRIDDAPMAYRVVYTAVNSDPDTEDTNSSCIPLVFNASMVSRSFINRECFFVT